MELHLAVMYLIVYQTVLATWSCNCPCTSHVCMIEAHVKCRPIKLSLVLFRCSKMTCIHVFPTHIQEADPAVVEAAKARATMQSQFNPFTWFTNDWSNMGYINKAFLDNTILCTKHAKSKAFLEFKQHSMMPYNRMCPYATVSHLYRWKESF